MDDEPQDSPLVRPIPQELGFIEEYSEVTKEDWQRILDYFRAST